MGKKAFKVIVLFLFVSCSNAMVKEPKESLIKDLNLKEYGILIFSHSFAENNFREKLYVNYQLADSFGNKKEFKLEEEDDKIYVYFLKAGEYVLKEVKISASGFSSSKQQGNSPEIKNVKTPKKWVFKVQPGKINYAGNFFVQDFSDDSQKYSTIFFHEVNQISISAEISIRKRSSDVVKVLEERQYLKKYFNEELESFMKEKIEIENKNITYLSKKSSQSISSTIFGSFSWGESVEKVKEKLLSINKKVMVVDQNTLVDLTDPNQTIEYVFISHKKSSYLYKVIYHQNEGNYNKILLLLKEQNGEPSKTVGKTVIWYSPFSKISLLKQSNETQTIHEDFNFADRK